MKILIESQTGAATKTLTVGNAAPHFFPHVPMTFHLSGTLTGVETITFQYYDGTTWKDIVTSDGDAEFTATINTVTLYGPMELRISKGVTVVAAGVIAPQIAGLKGTDVS